MAHQTLDTLKFDNRFIHELPADPETENYCRQVMRACYSLVKPAKVSEPQLIAYSKEVAEILNLTGKECESSDFAQVFSGNRILKGMSPYATCYGGHQFGHWAGQLGDGRAINLGEVINQQGERWALQLKGAGQTPYSRRADGLAVLRSSIREFLCSEAMFHLGVPTTRALSLTLTGEQVIRDMFYDGNPKLELGAVVCRVAPSFTRFGNFQIFSARREIDVLQQLVDYTILTDFSHLGKPSPEIYLKWFHEVCQRTAELIVHWMRVGFVHGVMNTDNMSILGLTIDYGPYGWLDDYSPAWTPNTTDSEGRRYCFGNQSQVAHWNLAQLARAIYPLIQQAEPLQSILDSYTEEYESGWRKMMSRKLGLNAFDSSDEALVTELLSILEFVETDVTIFFRQLALINAEVESPFSMDGTMLMEPVMDAYYQPAQLTFDNVNRINNWICSYIERVRCDGTSNKTRRIRMNSVNPNYVLRNYMAQLAIDKAEHGDSSMVSELLELLRYPYDERSENQKYAVKRPEWARNRPGCSMLSCSS